ncbi:hypothetical protein [Streptomyces sp. HUAS TT7]|uniref:hypothetical protein n=1 Tax=Streptomyces sp. HUAS TT7 TaxID=3447507 RepID=UPI003F6602BA
MNTAADRLDALLADLQRNSHVEVVHCTSTPPLSAEQISHLSEQAGCHLPSGAEEFYRQVGSFSLEWRHTVSKIQQGDRSDYGLINILPVNQVLGDWSGVTWFRGGDETYRPVVPFDMFTPEACAAFERREDGTFKEEISYHYFGEELSSLNCTFGEYIDLLIESRGYWYWQKTLCAGHESSTEVTDFRQNMPMIFPEYNDDLFRPRSA